MTERATYPDGFHPEMPLDHYFADPAQSDWGSLNQSNIPFIRNRSPLHLAVRAPVIAARLGLQMSDDVPNAAMRRGQIVHRLALGKGMEYDVRDYPDFRTKEAREWRDELCAEGRCPVLSKDWGEIVTQSNRLTQHLNDVFLGEDWLPEVAVIWTETTPFGAVKCRILLDAFCPSLNHAVDLKSTTDASQPKIIRIAEQKGHDIQSAWGQRALQVALDLTPNKIQFSTLYSETKIPFATQAFQLGRAWQDSAWDECQIALRLFAQCQERGEWPGYGRNPRSLPLPPWLNSRRIERQLEGVDLEEEPFPEEEDDGLSD